MKRRQFIKNVGILGASITLSCALTNQPKLKNWIWMRPNRKMTNDDYKALFQKMTDSGIKAILPEIYNGHHALYTNSQHPLDYDWLGQILPLAKSAGLEVHGWMWSMPCNQPGIQNSHPEWYAVNGLGESAVNKPAYVDYYKFLCPNREEVQNFIQTTVKEIASIPEIDGVHLDYIRFPDVILAKGLQPKYNIVQDREYPQYDYCYCEVCRSKFKEKHGIDPMELDDPSKDAEWIQFRYDSISNLVKNTLASAAREKNKMVTAAVFPNWEMVRQQWSTWNLDAVLPMLYNTFYNKGPEWIKHHTEKGIASLSENTKYYSGLFVPGMSALDLKNAINAGLQGGAKGISFFDVGSIKDEHWQVIKAINS